MALGIKPTVDFAFKRIFGSPENSVALLGLLNAILDLERPIENVEILNPFSYQEFAASKLVVLDVRCRDTAGRWLNVEMQVSIYAGLIERLVYYACSLYVDQLEQGQNYAQATTAISICLLRHRLFHETEQAHHRFQMLDVVSGRRLAEAIEIHTVELTKYNLIEVQLADRPKIEQWVYLLLYADQHESEVLRRMLPGIEFETAIRALEVMSGKTEDRQMYDQREKAQRDYEWALSGAREEGRAVGREEGREEGRVAGREEGRVAGRVEGREVGRLEGREEGKLAGKIQTLQELLGDPIASDAELMNISRADLAAQLLALQQRLRDREA